MLLLSIYSAMKIQKNVCGRLEFEVYLVSCTLTSTCSELLRYYGTQRVNLELQTV